MKCEFPYHDNQVVKIVYVLKLSISMLRVDEKDCMPEGSQLGKDW